MMKGSLLETIIVVHLLSSLLSDCLLFFTLFFKGESVARCTHLPNTLAPSNQPQPQPRLAAS